MKVKDYDFILRSYTPEEMIAIQEDIGKYAKGIQYLYVIDTYDLVENFMPYTKLNLFLEGNKNQLAQKFICYDYLFSNFDHNKIILANEYRDELLAVKNKLNNQLTKANAVLSNIKNLREQSKDFQDEEKSQEYLQKNFEIILFLLILNSREGKVFEEFLSFVRKRIVISQIVLSSKADEEEVNRVFDNTLVSGLSVSIFREFVDSNLPFLISLESELERQVFLENTFRDIQVIERVARINKEFKNKGLNYFVIYLSSAKKTSVIFDCMRKMKQVGDEFELDFHRNILQYFLMNKLSSRFGEKPKQMLAISLRLQEIRGILESVPLIDWRNYPDFEETVRMIFDEASSSIDNYFYLGIFDQYRQSFEKNSKLNSKTQLDPKLVRALLEEVDTNTVKLGMKLFQFGIGLSQIQNSIAVGDLVNNLTRRVPKDVIRNQYHLPILLFLHEEDHSWLKSLDLFINTLLEASKLAGDFKKTQPQLVHYLNNIFVDFQYSHSVKERLHRTIISAYVNFIANNKKITEDSLIAEMEGIQTVIAGVKTEVDLDKTSDTMQLQYKIGKSHFSVEVSYILIWLYRRNSRENDGITLSTDLIVNYPNEPRLVHGRALCYLALGYEILSEPDRACSYFEFAEQDLKKAQELYSRIETQSEQKNILITKTKTAILNSLANINLRRYDLSERNMELLNVAFDLINSIRREFDLMKLSFEDHATYLGTEIELRYFLALHLKGVGNLSMSREEITKASKLLASLKQLTDYQYSSEFFKDRFGKVPELMNELILMR
jgi:hypothetical protein